MSSLWLEFCPGFGIALHPSNPTCHQKSKRHKWRPARPPGKAPHVVPGGSTQNRVGKLPLHRWSISWSHLTPVTPRPSPWSHENVQFWGLTTTSCSFKKKITTGTLGSNCRFLWKGCISLRVDDCGVPMSENIIKFAFLNRIWKKMTVGCFVGKPSLYWDAPIGAKLQTRKKRSSGFVTPLKKTEIMFITNINVK